MRCVPVLMTMDGRPLSRSLSASSLLSQGRLTPTSFIAPGTGAYASAAALLPTAYSNAHFRSGMLKASHSHGQPIKQVDPHPTQEQWRAAHQQYANRTNAWRAHVWSINQAQAAKLRKYASAKGLRERVKPFLPLNTQQNR